MDTARRSFEARRHRHAGGRRRRQRSRDDPGRRPRRRLSRQAGGRGRRRCAHRPWRPHRAAVCAGLSAGRVCKLRPGSTAGGEQHEARSFIARPSIRYVLRSPSAYCTQRHEAHFAFGVGPPVSSAVFLPSFFSCVDPLLDVGRRWPPLPARLRRSHRPRCSRLSAASRVWPRSSVITTRPSRCP